MTTGNDTTAAIKAAAKAGVVGDGGVALGEGVSGAIGAAARAGIVGKGWLARAEPFLGMTKEELLAWLARMGLDPGIFIVSLFKKILFPYFERAGIQIGDIGGVERVVNPWGSEAQREIEASINQLLADMLHQFNTTTLPDAPVLPSDKALDLLPAVLGLDTSLELGKALPPERQATFLSRLFGAPYFSQADIARALQDPAFGQFIPTIEDIRRRAKEVVATAMAEGRQVRAGKELYSPAELQRKPWEAEKAYTRAAMYRELQPFFASFKPSPSPYISEEYATGGVFGATLLPLFEEPREIFWRGYGYDWGKMAEYKQQKIQRRLARQRETDWERLARQARLAQRQAGVMLEQEAPMRLA